MKDLFITYQGGSEGLAPNMVAFEAPFPGQGDQVRIRGRTYRVTGREYSVEHGDLGYRGELTGLTVEPA